MEPPISQGTWDGDVHEDEILAPWRWRNLRSMGLGVELWPLDWHWGISTEADQYGGQTALAIGPLGLIIHYSVGGLTNPLRLDPAKVRSRPWILPTPAPAEGEFVLVPREQLKLLKNTWASFSYRYLVTSEVELLDAMLAARPTPPVAGEVAEVIERLREMAAKMERGIVTIWPHPLNQAADLLSRLSASQGSSGAESGGSRDDWDTSYIYTVVQNGDEVAGGEGPDRTMVLQSARDYARQYAQDGPVDIMVWERHERVILQEGAPALDSHVTRNGEEG